jgi:DNA polymerase I-like protein with 3'-5' exonuclease and polymerase domains
MIKSVLMDARTTPDVWAKFIADMGEAEVVGLDCETQDENRHEGLKAFNNKKRHVFDHRRTIMTGFSVYPDGCDSAYYFNLAHADTENCLPKAIVADVIAMKKASAIWIAHNAPFELTIFQQCHGIKLTDIICSLQMAVSDHGPDEYAIDKFYKMDLSALTPIVPDILTNFRAYQAKAELDSDQQFTLGQFIGKTGKSTYNYNGIVDSIAWGFSLKKLTKSFYGVDQMTYDEVLDGRSHMGELTGEEVCAYGADDAYWAVMNYHYLVKKMMTENPAALVTFLESENPMIHVYADAWIGGLRVNQAEIFEWRAKERENYAQVMRDLKEKIRELLPFESDLDEEMIKWQGKWYEKSGPGKRAQITAWANSPDSKDSFTQCFQLSNPVGNAWAIEQNIPVPKSTKLNLGHYYGMRVLLHDLMGHKLVRVGGDISTNAEARGRMMATYDKSTSNTASIKREILKLITKMSQIEQSMKLYLTPYTQLMDPETGCLYSVVSSMLASRRMAARFPNPMQLAKRGESTYVRGFYLPDRDDHIIVSADWSSVELVEIGEFSGDPEFAKVFGQTPYGDLHSGAAVDILSVSDRYSWLTQDEFLNDLKRGRNPMNRDLRDFAGKEMDPGKWVKFMRTEIGKGANFNYWYSGALATVAEKMGFTSDQMWAAGDRYRERFAVAEKWRLQVIADVMRDGYITLPDGHRRVRFEATNEWYVAMRRKMMDVSADPAMLAFADLSLPAIQRRAKNQAVNTYIQGMCARLAKDTAQNMSNKIDKGGARFMMPIHDELLYSVHRDYAAEFIPLFRKTMCDHPKYIKNLPLHCTVAVGRTFKPYDAKNPAYSQIELDEAPVIEGVIDKEWDGKELPMEQVNKVIDWMMAQ